MIWTLVITTAVGILGAVLRMLNNRDTPPRNEPPPQLGWIIPGVLPGDVSKKTRGAE